MEVGVARRLAGQPIMSATQTVLAARAMPVAIRSATVAHMPAGKAVGWTPAADHRSSRPPACWAPKIIFGARITCTSECR